MRRTDALHKIRGSKTLFAVIFVWMGGLAYLPLALSDNMGSQTQPSTRKGHSLISLMFLLKKPRSIDAKNIQAAAERAFGGSFSGSDPARKIEAPPGGSGVLVKMPGIVLGILSSDKPYFTDVGKVADAIRDFQPKLAVQRHKAWLAVDLMEDTPLPAEKAYPKIFKLLAELTDNDCLALICTEPPQIVAYDERVPAALRGPDPMAVFELELKDEVLSATGKEKQLDEAEAEAHRRWGEFVNAFKRRRAEQGFAVKLEFAQGKKKEHMWIEVSGIDGDKIVGTLDNNPEMITGMKLGDHVDTDKSHMEDWIYSDGNKMIGGFSSKILEEK